MQCLLRALVALKRTTVVALLLLLGALHAGAVEARPRICLVLSGGGARGAAHIGVIKVLEELRIPIDCIVGTSMGSLVGGAYASGMSVAEMERFVAQVSTQALFDEKPPRPEQSIRRKLDDRSIVRGPELGFSNDFALTLPKGVVSGVQLETFLRRLSKVDGYHDFQALPIPYRAVATDLVTGTAVVFSAGELPNVMRASMSVPGVIAPAEIDGRLLVDGGLTNNLPVDVARSMGADIVIAVNLGTPLLTQGELKSLIGVTEQMVNILTEQNVRASLALLRPSDILIEPALDGFSAADFDHLAATIPIGERAARAVAPKLAALSLPEAGYAEWHERLMHAVVADTKPIDEIRFEPMRRVNPDAMTAMLETKPHEPLDQDELDRDLRRIFGTGDFEHVSYRILEEAGRRVLDIDAVEKSWGPNYLRFGLGLGSDLKGDSFFNLAASYRRTWVNSLGGEWRSDVQVGRTSRLATEFHQPLETRNTFFIAPRAEFERTTVDLFQVPQRIARYDVRTSRLALDFGSALTNYGEARIGISTGSVHASLDTGPPSLAPPNRAQQGAVQARAIIDTLDNANFPHEGLSGSANIFSSMSALGADDSYTKWDVDALGAHSSGPHTLQFALKFGGTIGGQPLPRYDQLQWGGFLQQSGYPTGSLLGQELEFGRVVYTYGLAHVKLLGSLYAGGSLELGRMGKPLVPGNPTGTLKSVAAFFGLDSLIGPLYIGYGWAADGNRSAYFFLGRP